MSHEEEIEVNLSFEKLELLVRNYLESLDLTDGSMVIFEDMHDDFYFTIGRTIVNEALVSALTAHVNAAQAEVDVAYAVPPGENKKPRYDAHPPTRSELEDLANSLNGE